MPSVHSNRLDLRLRPVPSMRRALDKMTCNCSAQVCSCYVAKESIVFVIASFQMHLAILNQFFTVHCVVYSVTYVARAVPYRDYELVSTTYTQTATISIQVFKGLL